MDSQLARIEWARCEGHSEALGEFLDWLRDERGLALCYLNEEHFGWFPDTRRTETILYEYFGIDPKAAEEERARVLADMRRLGGQ